ncbi:MAG: ShlB/FhaC/HecB family hemolysin secretion/activation protein [Cyanobacteria bacterium J06560_6]
MRIPSPHLYRLSLVSIIGSIAYNSFLVANAESLVEGSQPSITAQQPNPQPRAPDDFRPLIIPSEPLQDEPAEVPTPPLETPTELFEFEDEGISLPFSEDTIKVSRFHIRGSTRFSQEDFHEKLDAEGLVNTSITFIDLLRARSIVTEMYTENDYITTGAFLPDNQRVQPEDAEVIIQVVEGRVDDIQISGTRRLNPEYIRSRLRLGTSTPLRQKDLLDALRLLQIDPQIESITAALQATPNPGENVLNVTVTEASPYSVVLTTDNGRSPSVGSTRQTIQVAHNNLLGQGDKLSAAYNFTEGSDSYNLSYTIPITPTNTTASIRYGSGDNRIVENPFERFNIQSDSNYYQLSVRHPLVQTPTEEFALSLSATGTETISSLDGRRAPLSAGADIDGVSRLFALRFGQEWVKQNPSQVFAARSEFSLGLDAFNSTINDDAPDSRFFAWRGQLQWVQLLGPRRGTPPAAPLWTIRADTQFADQSLLSTEQFALGGLGTVRGYRQDSLLTDNGILLSTEAKLPVWRISDADILVQLIPFVDVGTGWNNGGEAPNPSTLASIGLGVEVAHSDNLTARLDWGIPLVNGNSEGDTWQENGFHFSLEYRPL